MGGAGMGAGIGPGAGMGPGGLPGGIGGMPMGRLNIAQQQALLAQQNASMEAMERRQREQAALQAQAAGR